MDARTARSFRETLDAAIADLVENGFDSMERVERWTRDLRFAAERSLVSERSLEDQLREGLAAIYRRMVDRGGVFRFNPEAERFTLERIKPALRSELDRRILASANLIKLNRQESIEKTLRRFQGWSTSIPPGGVSAEKRPEVKATVRKSLAQLPYEERRVLIDQGHKLTNAISETLAIDGGAIAGRWRSNWRQPGYDYRPDHKERDGEVYAVRGSWAQSKGLIRRGAGYTDEVTAPGQEVFCRCYWVWLYSLGELPEDMLTAKGRSALAAARGTEEVRSARFARADAAGSDGALGLVARLDRMRYLPGLRALRAVPDHGPWHAGYDTDADAIEVQPKLLDLPPAERVHVLLHEAGHRGQEVDGDSYEELKRRGLNTLASFLAMANQAHLAEYERRGEVEGGLAAEVFAESYARFCAGLEMPRELRRFWMERFAAKGADDVLSQAEARYMPTWHNPQTRCQRCSMFVRVAGGNERNACTAVAGEINARGHCRMFAAIDARVQSAA
jgi:hypothetical protein